MKMSPRRAGRIQNELRLRLREKYGVLDAYSKLEIDSARETLGFRSVDDALVAYSLFGPDLVPGFLASVETSISAEELTDAIDALERGIGDIADFFGDEGV